MRRKLSAIKVGNPIKITLKNRGRRLNNILNSFRWRLAHTEALPQLAILGLVSGIATGLVAVVFRLAMEWPLYSLLPNHNSEGFEDLPVELRLLLPLAGALVIAIIFRLFPRDSRDLGVSHVIDRYQHHQGYMPTQNAILQFFGGILSIISGHSVGREGPAVHLGAASSSLLGQVFKLPNNSLRILVGCGVASAIAASFNTPLAGVIFAMEVVLMEYTIAGFVPIILASVAGAVVSRICFGDSPAFDIPPLTLVSLLELPFLTLCGVLIGLASATVLLLHRLTLRLQHLPLTLRLLTAGLVAGVAGAVVPQVMGIGYDTLEQALLGQLGIGLLGAIVVAKILVSTTTLALGIPGGSIGPTLVTGACLGSLLGVVGSALYAGETTAPGFYAMIGMGAMMAGVLNAPLAALMALLELTYNPNILLPAMLVIVMSCITARLASRLPGLFLVALNTERVSSPVAQALNRIGVTSVMNGNFVLQHRHVPDHQARSLLAAHPEWVVITGKDTDKYILRAADLSRHLQRLEANAQSVASHDLLKIPAERWRLHPVSARATLHEAMQLIRKKNGFAVYVVDRRSGSESDVAGIISLEQIDNYYQ